MKLAIFLALFSLAAAASVSHEDVIAREWEQFKAQHGKSYATKEEESFRKNVFLENRDKIAQHNLRAANGEESFTLGMNEYGDLLHDEFNRMMNGYKNVSRRAARPTATFMAPLNTEVPKSVDWRDKGYVTPIKNQGNCGSCWAFSATGSLEGQTFRKTGKLVSLSEQNLVDCSTKYDNSGCKGGLMDSAFRYIKENNGIDTEESYPYEGRDGKCRFSKSKIGATDKGFVDIKEGDEEELTKAIATVGPVSVAIDASSLFFQFYRSGVYYGSSCSSTDLNHGVLAVGYGTDSKGRDYYIVKNSWGKSWGNSGYVLMSRNKKNNCGIATEASYPLV